MSEAPSPAIVEASEDAAPLQSSRLTALLGFRLTQVELVMRRYLLEALREFDLRPVEYSTLVLVDSNPGIIQRQIGEVLKVSPPNLVNVIGALNTKKLLSQVRSKEDRRVVHLKLTVAGKSLLKKAEKQVLEMEAGLAALLTASELRTFQRVLDKLDC